MSTDHSLLPPYVQRLVEELQQLSDRIDKLRDFMSTPNFQRVRLEERQLLTRQLGVMTEYDEILRRRVQFAESLS